LDFTAFIIIFRNKNFRAAAFGYFGHMWELYAFWTFVPILLATYLKLHPTNVYSIPLWSFLIIALGGLACVLSGYISLKFGTKRTASTALLLSCICCLLSPIVFYVNIPEVFIGFLIFWGLVVVADSPLFSTLVAKNTSPETKGTALTIVNCIGFSITIVSIQIINILRDIMNPTYLYLILSIGPILGLLYLYKSENSLD
jgi:hypothetical protein